MFPTSQPNGWAGPPHGSRLGTFRRLQMTYSSRIHVWLTFLVWEIDKSPCASDVRIKTATVPAPPSGCREDNRFVGINLRKPAIAFAPAGGRRRKPADELQDVPVVLGQIPLNDRLVMGYTIP